MNFLLQASNFAAPILLILCFFVSDSHSMHRCDKTLYGTPSLGACRATWSLIPEARDGHSPAAREHRLFVEPQYLRPPFSHVRSPYENDIIQVPKIWRTGSSNKPPSGVLGSGDPGSGADTWHVVGTCRIAILSIADNRGAVRHGSNIAAWNLILDAGVTLYDYCLGARYPAGGMKIVYSLTP